MRRILIATKNAHKTQEIRDILGPGWEISDLTVHPRIPAPEETGGSFEENARIKAESASKQFDGLVLSDDSGLEVDVLDGAPGVNSAAYAGKHGDDAANRLRLKNELIAHDFVEPCKARFRCVMALAENGRTVATFDGAVDGQVVTVERGNGGFGYDAMFVPDGYEGTFAELPAGVKNELSHRARALAKVRPFIDRLRNEPCS